MRKGMVLTAGIALASITVYAIESKITGDKGAGRVYTLDTVFDEISRDTQQEVGVKIVPCPETSIFKDYKYQFCGAIKDDLKSFAAKVHQMLGDEYEFSMPWRTDYGDTTAVFRVRKSPQINVLFSYVPKEFLDEKNQIPNEYIGAVRVFIEKDSVDSPGI